MLSLILLGSLETKFNLKLVPTLYEVYGENPDQLTSSVNDLLDDMHHVMESVQMTKSNSHYRMQFVVTGTNAEAQRLAAALHGVTCVTRVSTFLAPERE